MRKRPTLTTETKIQTDPLPGLPRFARLRPFQRKSNHLINAACFCGQHHDPVETHRYANRGRQAGFHRCQKAAFLRQGLLAVGAALGVVLGIPPTKDGRIEQLVVAVRQFDADMATRGWTRNERVAKESEFTRVYSQSGSDLFYTFEQQGTITRVF